MEKWELYDLYRQKTGVYVTRGEKVPQGYYHTVVHVCIFNSQGEMLIQQRQPFKHGWSNLWDVSVGGSAVAGDNSWQAAMREVKEELGLSIDLVNQRPSFTFSFSFGFDDVYIINLDVDLSSLHLQYEEVQQVRWATQEEIIRRIEDGSFISYHPSFIQLLFDYRKTKNIHSSMDNK